MKRCPECGRDYNDDSLNFCLDDGSELLFGPTTGSDFSDANATTVVSGDQLRLPSSEARTEVLRERIYTSTPDSNSIAVLPFANISADPENEYFCDGLAEELLNALAKIDRLNVAARTSAFSFKGKNEDVSEIGRVLNVAKVLDGSVRKSGDRLRITIQLINVADGFHVWSERYDREMRDIFALQDEIALAVIEALKVKLFGNEKEEVLKRYTDNTEVYELYLKGLYYYNKYTPEGWKRAVEFFESAISEDPSYAPAYAKLAAALAFAWFFGVVRTEDAIDRSRSAAFRALELDDRMEDAYEALGRWDFYHDWNWTEAEKNFQRGLEVNPKNAEIHAQYGLCMVAVGRFDDAVAEGERALELDPLSVLVNLQVGWIYLFSWRFEEALKVARKILEIEPKSYGAYCQLGVVLSAKKELKNALEAFRTSLELGQFQTNLSLVGSMYAVFGKEEEAQKVLDQLLEMKEREPVASLDIARVFSAMGDTQKSLDWLDRAVEERNGGLVFLRSKMSGFTTITRQHPRFANVLRQIGLPELEL